MYFIPSPLRTIGDIVLAWSAKAVYYHFDVAVHWRFRVLHDNFVIENIIFKFFLYMFMQSNCWCTFSNVIVCYLRSFRSLDHKLSLAPRKYPIPSLLLLKTTTTYCSNKVINWKHRDAFFNTFISHMQCIRKYWLYFVGVKIQTILIGKNSDKRILHCFVLKI